MLSLLAAVVQLNSAFHHVTTAYMRRRRDTNQQTETVPVLSGAIGPTLTGKALLVELLFQKDGEQT